MGSTAKKAAWNSNRSRRFPKANLKIYTFEKLYATDVAARVKGMRNIVNNMTVSVEWDTDAAIARRIQDFLTTNAELQWVAKQIHVAVNQGVVTLTGTVSFWSERHAAGEGAFETEGGPEGRQSTRCHESRKCQVSLAVSEPGEDDR